MNKLDQQYTADADDIFNKIYEHFCIEFHTNKMKLYYNLRIRALRKIEPMSQQEFLKYLTISN